MISPSWVGNVNCWHWTVPVPLNKPGNDTQAPGSRETLNGCNLLQHAWVSTINQFKCALHHIRIADYWIVLHVHLSLEDSSHC